LRDASRASFASVLRGDDGVVLVDIRRLAAEFRGEGTRGDTAERAVAPLAMDAEGVEGGRRVVVFGEKEDMNSRQKKKTESDHSHIRLIFVALAIILSLPCPTLCQPSLSSTISRPTRSRR